LQFFRFYNLAVATQYSWEGGSRPAWTGREDVDKPTKALAGQRVRRKEDLRFITGEGRYLDDIRLPDMTHALVLRSPHAHARIKAIKTKRASALPGVLAIYTAADLDAAKIGTLPVGWIVPATN